VAGVVASVAVDLAASEGAAALGVAADSAVGAVVASEAAAPRGDGDAVKLARLMRHLSSTRWSTRQRFTVPVLEAIESAIREVEQRHSGEIRFAVESALHFISLWHDLPPRRRATQVFGQLGVWDTAENNGVLIYVLMADHVVEIVADRGIAARIPQTEWDEVCREIERQFRAGQFKTGSVGAVQAVGRLIARHFPASRPDGADELPNQPVLL
jgi:uncharacterized membrane protein